MGKIPMVGWIIRAKAGEEGAGFAVSVPEQAESMGGKLDLRYIDLWRMAVNPRRRVHLDSGGGVRLHEHLGTRQF